MDLEGFKHFFTQLFTEMSNENSIIVLTFLLGAFLIGLLFGWWSGRSGVRKLKKQLKKKEDDLISLRAEQQATQEQLGLKEADLTKAHLEIEELKTKIAQVENEHAKVNLKLSESSTALESLKAEHLASLSQIEVLNNQVADFELATTTDENDDYNNGQSIANVDLTEVESKYDNASIRISAIEDKLARLERENANLKLEINSIKADDSPIAFLNEDPVLDTEEDDLEIEDVAEDYAETVIMDPEERAALARQNIQAAFGKRIVVATVADKDDLKKINGIGPFIEQKLNDIGIYTFDQVSQFDDDLINQVTDAIQFFPGRIKRDDWVGQARQLKA